jgi:hypothetical protein
MQYDNIFSHSSVDGSLCIASTLNIVARCAASLIAVTSAVRICFPVSDIQCFVLLWFASRMPQPRDGSASQRAKPSFPGPCSTLLGSNISVLGHSGLVKALASSQVHVGRAEPTPVSKEPVPATVGLDLTLTDPTYLRGWPIYIDRASIPKPGLFGIRQSD